MKTKEIAEIVKEDLNELQAMAGGDALKTFKLIVACGMVMIDAACELFGVNKEACRRVLFQIGKESDEKMEAKKMVFIIQDIEEYPDMYIASRPTLHEAEQLKALLEEMDRDGGDFTQDRYRIMQREYCYSVHAEKCGHINTGICMLEDPETNCPVAMQRKGNT